MHFIYRTTKRAQYFIMRSQHFIKVNDILYNKSVQNELVAIYLPDKRSTTLPHALVKAPIYHLTILHNMILLQVNLEH